MKIVLSTDCCVQHVFSATMFIHLSNPNCLPGQMIRWIISPSGLFLLNLCCHSHFHTIISFEMFESLLVFLSAVHPKTTSSQTGRQLVQHTLSETFTIYWWIQNTFGDTSASFVVPQPDKSRDLILPAHALRFQIRVGN